MPIIIGGSRRGGRILATALGLAAFMAAPAEAGKLANPEGCTPQPVLSQAFAAWNDLGQYTPVENAGLEQGTTGWTLAGDATVVDDNEPWKVGGADHEKSLALGAGSSAVTAPICIDPTYPHFRLFARDLGAGKRSLKIEVLFLDKKGNIKSSSSHKHTASSSDWQPTSTININVFDKATTVEAAPVAFRFTPMGPGARYLIDDVYVDPWART